mmetsp:Transcript_10780/g.14927  ORF Transcript_10780/g.14927 Transcript_10780/m.14927 type:complete len:298 (+) Transcript_10780:408-1301(+)
MVEDVVIGHIIVETENDVSLKLWFDQGTSSSSVGEVCVEVFFNTLETKLRIESRDAQTGFWLGTTSIDILPLLIGQRHIMRVEFARNSVKIKYSPRFLALKGDLVKFPTFTRSEQNCLPSTARIVDDTIPSMPLVEWTKCVERDVGITKDWVCRARLHSNILIPCKERSTRIPSIRQNLRERIIDSVPISSLLFSKNNNVDEDAADGNTSFHLLRNLLLNKKLQPLVSGVTRRILDIWTFMTGTESSDFHNNDGDHTQEQQRRRRLETTKKQNGGGYKQSRLRRSRRCKIPASSCHF